MTILVTEGLGGTKMVSDVKQIVVTSRIEFIFEVSVNFDIHNDDACTSLMSNGTPVKEDNDMSKVVILDTRTGEQRKFHFEG